MKQRIEEARLRLGVMIGEYVEWLEGVVGGFSEEQRQRVRGSFEWPGDIEGWTIFEALISRLFAALRIKFKGRFNGCMYGWKYQGVPVKKLLEIWFTDEKVAAEFGKLRDRSHDHVAIAGRVTRTTQDYPAELSISMVEYVGREWDERHTGENNL